LGLHVINPLDPDFKEQLFACNNGERFHKVYEVSAAEANYELMFECVKARGTIILLGLTSNQYPFNTMACVFQEADVKAIRIHSQESFRYAARILSSGQLSEKLEQIITHEFPFEEIKEAMQFSINDNEHMKVLIRF
jgi:threonine dehydrogenase-like Zn-dependent dehydrogenase